MTEESLESLFDRFQRAGDVAALGEVFDRAAPELSKVARHLCADEAEAEDALQASFQTAIEKRSSWDPSRPFLPWMVGILGLHAKKARERAERRIESARLPERAVADPAELVADEELSSLVRRAIDKLPELYGQALRGYLFEGRRTSEIASKLGITANATSVRLHRGLRLLRRALPAGTSLGALGLWLEATPARGLQAVRAQVLELSRQQVAAAGGAGLGGAGLAASGAGASATFAALLSSNWSAIGLLATAAVASLAALPLVLDASEPSTPSSRALRPESSSLAAATDGPSLAPAALSPLTPVGAGRAGVALVPPTQPDPEAWLRRFEEAQGWRAGLALGYELAQLDDEESLAILQAIWTRIPEVAQREQLMKPFVFDGGRSTALELLDLAANDAALGVQARAFTYLKAYAYRDFAEDFGAYRAWRARYAQRPLAEVLRDNARELVERLGRLQGALLVRELRSIGTLDLRPGQRAGLDLAALLRDAGLLDLTGNWIEAGDPELQELAFEWLARLEAPEAWLRTVVLPHLVVDESSSGATFAAACGALGSERCAWARLPLLEAFRTAPAARRSTLFAPMRALADIGSPESIPILISMIVADPNTRYPVGHYALADLTGVRYDDSHDGAFWLQWWENNRARLPASVGASEIPEIQYPN